MLRHLVARLRAFFRVRDLDGDFDQELQSHIVMLTEENVRRGMAPEEARRAALVRIGGVASLEEQHRDVRGLPAVESVLQDLRFTFRLMARERWFSAPAIVTLALGIGVNAIGFTIVNTAFLRGLPFAAADRLHAVSWQHRNGRRVGVSHAELRAWREQSRAFSGLAGYDDATMNVSDDRALPQPVQGTWLTANTFGVLRQPPLLGRDFAAGDDRRGAEPVAIIGYGLWKGRYGGNPNVLGTPLRINGQPATIIGVMPDGMRFPNNSELWVPAVPTDAQENLNVRLFNVIGRLKDAASATQAQTDMIGMPERLAALSPDGNKELTGVRVEPVKDRLMGGWARTLFMTIMTAVTFVLFIACGNVANLLLSRAAYRAGEIAVRRALGATRWRVVRQLLIESVMLAVAGGGAGLLLAAVGVRIFEAASRESNRPYWLVFTLDGAVFGYVAAICIATAVFFGLAPALHASNAGHVGTVNEAARGSIGSRRVRWFSHAMVVAELALTIILLAGAGLIARSFVKLYGTDIGIDTHRVMTMRLELPAAKYGTPDARRAFFSRLEPRLTAIAGVEAAAVTNGVPPRDGGERLLQIDGPPAVSGQPPQFVGTVTVSPRFFDVLNRPMLRGRGFTDADGAPGSEVVIVNERLAAKFFPGEDPIGRRLRFTQRQPRPGQAPDVWRTIIGINAPIEHGSLRDGYLNAVIYIPYRQEARGSMSLLLRSAVPPASVMDAVRREVQAIDRDQPVYDIQTVAQLLAQDRWPYQVFGGLFAILAAIALGLSSVGLYGVMAYAVAQRTREIGVRVALGAQRQQVSWLILRRGLVQLAIGLPLGLAGAVALGTVLEAVLVDMKPGDPLTLTVVVVVLTAVVVAACLIPARRAAHVDPVVALRAE